jgi:hypothetical protein
MLSLDDFIRPGSPLWWLFLGMLTVARGLDLLSTYIATPNLRLEGNPVARWLGWRGGLITNIVLVLLFSTWPLLAISLTTTSLLVAARNLQSAWIMRSMGEIQYRLWMSDRLAESPRGLALVCFLGEALLFGCVGIGLMVFAEERLIPFAVGMGICGYGVAVALFTSLSLWRATH